MEEGDFRINEEKQRFELEIDGVVSIIDYTPNKRSWHLPHTYVPKEISGRGVASKLAKHSFDYMLENNINAVPICPFLVKFVKKHPEYNSIIVDF